MPVADFKSRLWVMVFGPVLRGGIIKQVKETGVKEKVRWQLPEELRRKSMFRGRDHCHISLCSTHLSVEQVKACDGQSPQS